MFFAGALNIAVVAVTEVLTKDHLKRLTEVLGDLIAVSSVHTPVLIFYIGSLHAGTIPLCRKTGTDNALTIERLGNHTKESLYQCAAADSDAIAEITITLPSRSIILADLSKVGRRLSIIHLVKDVRFHQTETFVSTSCLIIGQSRVHHLSSRHIVDAPAIGEPVGGGNGFILNIGR